MEFKLLIVAITLSIFGAKFVEAARGPPRISSVVEPVIANVGDTLKLPCPVDGEPAPLFEWFRDGESLIMAEDRIRPTKNGLKIKDAEVDDSAIYECKAVNGFGQVTIEVELWIKDPRGGEESSSFGGKGGSSLPPLPVPPRMVDHSWGDGAGPMMGGVFRRTPGTNIRLRCVALGEPRPWVKWYKDGSEITGNDWRSKIESRWSFLLENLKRSDSGVYTCRAGNKLGAVSVNFTMEVYDEMNDKPEMMDEHPVNTTVTAGESATLQCRVKSESQPRIQWLKRLESPAEEAKYLNESVPLQGDRYLILNTSSTTTMAKDTYLNRLVVPATKREDAGLYVCLAANKMGYSFRKAFLTVEPPLVPIVAEDERKASQTTGSTPATTSSTSSSMTYVMYLTLIGTLVVVAIAGIIGVCVMKRKWSPGGHRRDVVGSSSGGLVAGSSGAALLGPNGATNGFLDNNGMGVGFGASVGINGKTKGVNGTHPHGCVIDQHQQQLQPFLPHQQTAVLNGQQQGRIPTSDNGFRYKLVPQQETPPIPAQPPSSASHQHSSLVYKDSSSDASSHMYQKLPLGSSAASPNGIIPTGPASGPSSRGSQDSGSCRHCGPAGNGQQGYNQQAAHHQHHRQYPQQVGGNQQRDARNYVHFSSSNGEESYGPL